MSRHHKGADISMEDIRVNFKLEASEVGHSAQIKSERENKKDYNEIRNEEDRKQDTKVELHAWRESSSISSVISETVDETPRNRVGETDRLPPHREDVQNHRPTAMAGQENMCISKKVKMTKYPTGKIVTVTTYFRHCRSKGSGYGSSSSFCSSDDDL